MIRKIVRRRPNRTTIARARVPALCHRRPSLSDGSSTSIHGIVTIPVEVLDRQITHEFQVMSILDMVMLIGIDLWMRTHYLIPPPPIRFRSRRDGPRVEGTRLPEFLDAELVKFHDVRGPNDFIEHRIHINTPFPVKQRYRPRSPAMQKIIDKKVGRMEAAGVIEPSSSAWSSSVVIVSKKDGRSRFCIDFCKINEVTERDAHPLPQIDFR